MTTRIGPPRAPAARHPIMSGGVMVGALFPPAREGQQWQWTLFQLGARHTKSGYANTQTAATNAALAAWRAWLRDAELTETP